MSRGDGRSGAFALRLILVIVLIVGGAGAGLYFAGDRVTQQLHDWFASSGGGDLAAVPQPRGGGETAPPSLADMPALVGSNATTPESWPALSPADLLAQKAALGDRALADTAFDQPPARRFARPFTGPENRPRLGLLITGLGLDRGVTAAAIAGLPADVSLSFDPNAAELADWIAAARVFGHEALVDLPLQSKDKRDPGAQGLVVGLNDDEADRRIDAIAGAAPQVLGITGIGGDALLLDDTAAAQLAREVARLGLAFIDTSGEPMSLAGSAAKQAGLTTVRSGIALDERPAKPAILERLAAAADLAQEQGRVLAVAKASPITITTLADWLRRLDDQGPLPAPASALLQR